MLLYWMRTSLGASAMGSRARVWGAVLAGSTAVLAAMSFGAAGASALTSTANCALPGSDFQGGDGNQATPTLAEQTFCTGEGLATMRDWQDLTNVVNSPDANVKDNEFEGGDKESEPGKWGIKFATAAATPPKANILSGWSQVETGETETFLHLAFEREATTGDTYLTFELDKVKGLWNNGISEIPCRTTGDVLISYNVAGKPPPKVVVYRWVTDAFKETATTQDPTPQQCATSGHFEPAAGEEVATPDEQGEMNFSEEIHNYLPDTANGTPESFAAGSFGEAALNLTHIFEGADLGPCFSFGQMWMSSRSSESIESQLQDYVSPAAVQTNSCSISGRKFDDANGSGLDEPGKPGLGGWTIQLLDSQEHVLAETETDSEGNYAFTGVNPGSYIVREVGQAGWTCDYPGTGTSCQHSVTLGEGNINSTGNDFGNRPASTVVTTQQPAAGVVGSSFGDSATVSGPKGAPTPTGTVQFTLYGDSECRTAVAGPIAATLAGGSAAIPDASKVAPATAGTYYWVARYGGDAYNAEASSGCSDEPVAVENKPPPSSPPASPAVVPPVVSVPKAVVEPKCTLTLSSIVLHGAGGSRSKPFTVSIGALGIKQIVFYLDKHKLKTLTQKQAKKGRYTIEIDPRRLRFGAHTVSVKTVMTDAACASIARAGVFIHPHPPLVRPKFTG